MTKRLISALLIVFFLFSMVGCANEEIGFYSLIKDILQLEVFQTSGTVSISLQGQTFKEMLQELPEEAVELRDVINSGFEIKYTLKEKKNPLEYEIVVEFRKKGDNDFKKVTTIIGNDSVLYLKFDDLLKFIKPFVLQKDPSEEKVINELISKVEYVEVDLKTGTYDGIYNTRKVDPVQNEKLTKFYIGFMDIFKEALGGFSTNAVASKNNGYELKLGAKDLQQLIIKFAEYLVNNIDTIVNKATVKINSMSDDDIKSVNEAFGQIEFEKSKIISQLEDFREKVKETSIEDIEEMKSDSSFNEAFNHIDGSLLTYYIGKPSADTYDLNINLRIKYEDKFLIDIVETAKTEKLSSFSITKPSKTISTDGVKEIVSSIIPPRLNSMRISFKSWEAKLTYSNGKDVKLQIPSLIRDGNTYVPLRTIGEAFGESVGWNDEKKVPYVNRKGDKIEMNGFIENGITFVKVRDFQKLDYSVYWNKRTQEVTIFKYYESSIFE